MKLKAKRQQKKHFNAISESFAMYLPFELIQTSFVWLFLYFHLYLKKLKKQYEFQNGKDKKTSNSEMVLYLVNLKKLVFFSYYLCYNETEWKPVISLIQI